MGTKKIYLPKSVYTLVRGSGKLPPNQAMFHVPLNTNKFDVRDYLYNLYNLETTSVKVMIQQGELQRGTKAQRSENLHFKQKLPWKRASASKRVIVTMNEPFVYPPALDTYEALEPWQVETTEKLAARAKNGRRGLNRPHGGTGFVFNGRDRLPLNSRKQAKASKT